jgi:hypothetical protein
MLATIISYLVPAVLGWLSKEAQLLVSKWLAERAIDQAASDSVKPLEEAKTADEVKKATDSALSGL